MFWRKKTQAEPVVQTAEPVTEDKKSDVKTTLKKERQPRFEREYEAVIAPGITAKVEYYTGYGGRYNSGELTQSNGRWVLFDPDRVADKILDPALVPLVEAFCQEVKEMDREFIASKPSEFTDEKGTVWRRAA